MISNEQKLLKERIQALLRHKRYSLLSISDNDSERVRLGRQINGSSIVSIETVQKLLLLFHDIDANWLLMGEGFMTRADNVGSRIYHTENHNQVAENGTQFGPINIGRDATQVIKGRDELNYEQTIAQLQKRVRELEEDKAIAQNALKAILNSKQ